MSAWLLIALLVPAERAAAFDASAKAARAKGLVNMAVIDWERAYAVQPEPRFLLSIATTLASARRPDSCEESARAFARFFEACGDCAAAAEGRELQARLAPACSARLELAGDGEGGLGEALEALPRALSLWAGRHRLVLKERGRRSGVFWCAAPGGREHLEVRAGAVIAVPEGLKPGALAFAHQEAALAHAQSGRFCAAVADFEAAHAAQPEPGFVYNLALAWANWPGRCAEAIAAFDRFLEACPECPQSAEARRRRAHMQGPCSGTLAVTTEPVSAVVQVGGAPTPSPFSRTLRPGSHRLLFQAPGHREVEVTARVYPGEVNQLTLTLEPLPGAPPGPWPWVAGGLGVASLGAGAFFAWRADQDREDVDALMKAARAQPEVSRLDEAEAKLIDYGQNRALAFMGFGLGLVGLGVGGVLWWMEFEGTAVAPTPEGVVLGGVF